MPDYRVRGRPDAGPEGWEAVAAAFATAAEGRDAGTLEGLYHPDARFWNNVLGHEHGAEQALQLSRLEAERIADYAFEDACMTPHAAGFVLQMTVTGTTAAGDSFRIPACLVVELHGDRIARIDEYVDSTQAAPLFTALLG